MDDARLNALSEQFDPAVALLYADRIVPVDGAPRDTVRHCASLLHPSDPNYRPRRSHTRARPRRAPPAANPRDQQEHALAGPEPKPEDARHVDGPLGLLSTLLERRLRVRVVIRRHKGVRGCCTGYLKAFDKHFNMVLLDVEETFHDFEWTDRANGNGRRKRKVVRRRCVRQLLIRGDAVVIVGSAPPG
ncbi:hypothetical protein PBRA_002481 [Plasmodiophora brassicae]|uniref:Sm domain-containing protein n=1 Tax=Plasmodiophora brassicae TaxID=37360 RepID=A0A0G4J4N7_PLABS|nr:hypothetical protein PBRA_002481 [Plasmodiophora brassicae]